MMKLLVVLLALAFGVGVALYSFDDTNYVVIGAGEWVFQTSLTVFLGLLFVAFVPLYLVVRTLFAVWRSPRTFRAWRRQRKDRNAQTTLNNGLTFLIEGRWRAAERELLKAIDAGANPLLGYIAAARAAQALGASERRDEHLRRATDAQPTSSVAIGLTQAELHIAEQQREQALATLLQLRAQTPNHDRILALLRSLFVELHDYKSLLEILPSLKSRRLISPGEAVRLERRCLCGLLVVSATSGDAGALSWRWGTLSRSMRQEPEVLGLYTELKLRAADASECESLLRAALNRHWEPELARLYGMVPGDTTEQLKTAEHWLSTRQDDAMLLECLGRLCVRNRLWGKARSYLDASLAVDAHAETYSVLVELLDQIDDREAAGEYARRGLEHAAPRRGWLSDPEWSQMLSSAKTAPAPTLPAPTDVSADMAGAAATTG